MKYVINYKQSQKIKIKTMEDRILKLPYFSQFLDTKPEYHINSCGMVTMYCVMHYFKKKYNLKKRIPSLNELISLGHQEKGKVETGWMHDYLIAVAYKYGTWARRKSKPTLEFLKTCLDNETPVMMSVKRKCLVDIGTHFVALVGYNKTGFYFIDVARQSRKHADTPEFCTYEAFAEYATQNSIYFESQ